MSDFNILINGAPAPPIVNLPSTIKDTVTLTLVATDGAAGHARLVSIDTQDTLVPISAAGPSAGQLDATGKFQFTVGPGNVFGAFLRGNFTINVKVADHARPVKFQLF
jgi:hypothetical protein